MPITVIKCEWTNEWLAYNTGFVDDFIPYGRGETEAEALCDFISVMSDYVNHMEMLSDYHSEASLNDVWPRKDGK